VAFQLGHGFGGYFGMKRVGMYIKQHDSKSVAAASAVNSGARAVWRSGGVTR
jgi:hypothetical protein